MKNCLVFFFPELGGSGRGGLKNFGNCSTNRRRQECELPWFFGGFKFACLSLLNGQVFVGMNPNLTGSGRFVVFARGVQVPRIVRVVRACLDSCAVALGARTSPLFCGRHVMLVHRRPAGASPAGVEGRSRRPPVTQRGTLGEIGLPGPLTEARAAPPDRSATTPTPTQPAEKGPAPLVGQRSTVLRQELEELARSCGPADARGRVPRRRVSSRSSAGEWSERDARSASRVPTISQHGGGNVKSERKFSTRTGLQQPVPQRRSSTPGSASLGRTTWFCKVPAQGEME